jgi:hypothetical protein
MAIDDTKVCVDQYLDQGGETMHVSVIMKDEMTYLVDEGSQSIFAMAGLNDSLLGGVVTEYEGIEKTGEGEGTVDGKTLPYVEYSEDGGTVRYYLENGSVYAMETVSDGYTTTMLISNASNTVPAGVFDLPEGYTTIEV